MLGVYLGFISTETGPNWRNATKHKNPGSLTAQHFAGIHGNWRNKTIIIRNQQVVCSSHIISSKMNDPTQFEQVDETCEFGGAVLYSESLGITAFFENVVPSKYETQKLKQLQFGIENEKIRQFEHECLIRLFQWSFLPPGKALDFSVCDEAFGCYKTQYRKRHLLEICQNASFLSTPDRKQRKSNDFRCFHNF